MQKPKLRTLLLLVLILTACQDRQVMVTPSQENFDSATLTPTIVITPTLTPLEDYLERLSRWERSALEYFGLIATSQDLGVELAVDRLTNYGHLIDALFGFDSEGNPIDTMDLEFAPGSGSPVKPEMIRTVSIADLNDLPPATAAFQVLPGLGDQTYPDGTIILFDPDVVQPPEGTTPQQDDLADAVFIVPAASTKTITLGEDGNIATETTSEGFALRQWRKGEADTLRSYETLIQATEEGQEALVRVVDISSGQSAYYFGDTLLPVFPAMDADMALVPTRTPDGQIQLVNETGIPLFSLEESQGWQEVMQTLEHIPFEDLKIMTDEEILGAAPQLDPADYRLSEVYGTAELIASDVLRYGGDIYVTYRDDTEGVVMMAVNAYTGETMHAIHGTDTRHVQMVDGQMMELEGPPILVLTRQEVSDFYRDRGEEKWHMLNPKFGLRGATDMVVKAVTYAVALKEELNYNADENARVGNGLHNNARLAMQDEAIDLFFVRRHEAVEAGEDYGWNGNFVNPIVVEAGLTTNWHVGFRNEQGVHVLELETRYWHTVDLLISETDIIGTLLTSFLRMYGPYHQNNNVARVGDPPIAKTYDMTDRIAQAMCTELPSLEGTKYIPGYGGVPTSITTGDHPQEGNYFVTVPEYRDMLDDCALVYFSKQ